LFDCGAFGVLTYLAVSSVLNIALGYALAMYLGQTRAPRAVSTTSPTSPPASQPSAPAATTTPLAATAARIDPQPALSPPPDDKGWAEAFLKAETAAEPAPPEPVAAAPASADSTATPAASSIADALAAADRQPVEESPIEEEESTVDQAAPPNPEVEQELLAGIEEFRNQLAQLKGGTAEQSPATQPTAVQTN
jgi:hypothetical protein